MSEPITYVGIDAHKVELHVALLAAGKPEPVTWTVRNEVRAVDRLRRKLEQAVSGPVACCYEAGPCGYALQRQLDRGRVQCQVLAPALVPREPGERIKTDRRDTRKLAELHRAGLLTVVQAPMPAEGAVRDLCRLVMTPARIANGAATASASSCFREGCTTRAMRGPRRTDAGSMI